MFRKELVCRFQSIIPQEYKEPQLATTVTYLVAYHHCPYPKRYVFLYYTTGIDVCVP